MMLKINQEVIDSFLSTYYRMHQEGDLIHARRLLYTIEKALIVLDDRKLLLYLYQKPELIDDNMSILFQLAEEEDFCVSSYGTKLKEAVGNMSLIVRTKFLDYRSDINELIIKMNGYAQEIEYNQNTYDGISLDTILLVKEVLIDRRIPGKIAKKMFQFGITYEEMISFDMLYYYVEQNHYSLEYFDSDKRNGKLINHFKQLSQGKIDFCFAEDNYNEPDSSLKKQKK